MATIVYRYGLLPPTHNADLARDHLRAANRYRNWLIEMERGRRSALRAAELSEPRLAALNAAVAWLDAECRELGQEAKRYRKRHRVRKIPDALREEITEAKQLLERAKHERYTYRMEALPRMQAERDRIQDLAAGLRRNIRKHRRQLSGKQLHHGTYTLIEGAVGDMAKQPLWDKGRASDPHFVPYRGEGSLGMQIPHGITAGELRDSTRVQIGPPTQVSSLDCRPGKPGTHRRCPPDRCTRHERDPDRLASGRNGGIGARQAVTLRLRQESDKRKPVWIEWPMRLDRPIPEDAKIMRVNVMRRLIETDVGIKEEWAAFFTLRVPEKARRNDGLAVAIDVGWRPLPDGAIRVAYWRGEDGRHGQLVLTAHQVGGLTKAKSLQSIRDRHFDVIREALVRWADAQDQLPPWLEEARKTLARWRSPRRLRALVATWQEQQPQGEEVRDAMLGELLKWADRDRHLGGFERGQREGAVRQRRDHYRRFARWLSRRYDILVLEYFDKRAFSRAPQPEKGALVEDTPLHQLQRLASPSELVNVAKSRFGQDGRWAELPAARTTLDCSEPGCDGVLDGDLGAHITQPCSKGHVHDQDDNASKNLLIRFRERWDGGDWEGTRHSWKGAETESRWERARRLHAEKEQRKETARNAGDNAAE